VPAPTEGLIVLFHPHSDLLWDTWLVEHDSLYYLFYIRVSASGPPDAAALTIGAGWDAVNLATSSDLLHWTEQGTVLTKDPEALWLGTGMIHRAGSQFIMNFSEERPRGHQVISFAASTDLRTWRRLPAGHDLRPDGVLYQADAGTSADPLPRWDSIGIIAPGGDREEYLGLLCADTASPARPGQCGVLGLLSSADGLSWTPRPPAAAPGLFPSFEVPEHVEINGRNYVLFSTNTTAGARFVPGDPVPQGGTYYVVSSAAAGPYVPPSGHPLLHGHRIPGREFGTYVGRPFVTSAGDLLFYHHWSAGGPDGWWGPPKRLTERAPWVLGLEYWPGCEALKAGGTETVLTSEALRPLRPAGTVPVVDWTVTGADAHATNAGGAHGARWADPAPETDDNRGRVLETGIRIDSGRGLGLWVGYRANESMFVVSLNAASQQLELGTITWIKDGSSLSFHLEETVDWPLATGVTYQARLLVRHSFAELYLDDQLAKSFACRNELALGTHGFFCDLADGAFTAPRRWLMTL
jgi:hypothetical protein